MGIAALSERNDKVLERSLIASIWSVAVGVFSCVSLPASAVEIVTSATLTCQFDAECFETEPCKDADFEIVVTGTKPVNGNGFKAKRMDSIVFSLDAEGETDESSTVINAQDGVNGHLILATPEGFARYVNVVITKPQVTTYHGTCQMGGAG